LLTAIAFNAVWLWPETLIEQIPVNDLTFHIQASRVILHESWLSAYSLGFPLWRVYPPLPHFFAALLTPIIPWPVFYFSLLALLPAPIYYGARLLGMSRFASGLASLLILAISEEVISAAMGLATELSSGVAPVSIAISWHWSSCSQR